jgi:hypothetical protein
MKTGLLVLSSAVLFLLAAKAHGRELRLERQAAGFPHISFGSPDMPAFVQQMWQRERVAFWTVTVLLAIVVGAKLLASDAARGVSALVVLTWVPAASFAGLGLWSLWRKGLSTDGAGGSFAWWSLVLGAFVAAALAARSHFNPA